MKESTNATSPRRAPYAGMVFLPVIYYKISDLIYDVFLMPTDELKEHPWDRALTISHLIRTIRTEVNIVFKPKYA